MSEKVGELYYEVDIETAKMIAASRKAADVLNVMGKGARNASDGIDKLDESGRRASSSMGTLKSVLSGVASAISVALIIDYGKAFLEVADNVTQLQARIARLTSGASEARETFSALSQIASNTGASLQETQGLWEKLTSSLKRTGATNQQILFLTDTLQKIGRVGGSSAEEMANGLRQFGQSLDRGSIQAEEFNSIVESIPELARQIAAGMGLSMGQLRQAMLDGKISSQAALNAIAKQSDIVNQEFNKLPRTMEQANNSLTVSLSLLVGKMNEATGASQTMVAIIDSISAAIDRMSGRVETASQKIADLTSTGEMYSRRARTWAFLGLDGWAKQNTALSVLSDRAATLVGDLDAVGKASQNVNNSKGGFGNGITANPKQDNLIQISERRLALAKLEGEARARLQAQYDAADAGITDQKRIKALQDEYAETYRVTEARKESNKEGKTSATQAESIAQKLANLRAQSDLTTESIEKRRIQEAGLRAEQSLGSAATQQQLAEARALGEANEKAAISIQKRKEAEQGQKYAKQEIAAGSTSVNPMTGVADDPLAQINLQETQKLEALANYQEIDKQNTQLYEDAKTAIQLQASNARMQIAQTEADQQRESVLSILGSASQGFDSLASIIADSAGKSNAAYQVMFAASKAFAIAQSTLSLNTAIMQAMADPTALTPAQKLANYAAIASAGASLLSNVASISYGGGREHGGPVSASSMYRVGEGGKPEIFKASNGSQYMIPGDNGRVISNRDIGGGGGAFNYSPVIQVNGDPTEQTLAMLEAAVKRGAQQGYAMAVSDVASGKGKLSNALTNNFNTSQRLT